VQEGWDVRTQVGRHLAKSRLTLRVDAEDWLCGDAESCHVTASVAMVARRTEPVTQGSVELGYASEDQVEHWAPVADAFGGAAVHVQTGAAASEWVVVVGHNG